MARMSLENMLWKCESCGWQKKEPVPDAMMLPIYCPKCKQGTVKIRRLRVSDNEGFIERLKGLFR